MVVGSMALVGMTACSGGSDAGAPGAEVASSVDAPATEASTVAPAPTPSLTLPPPPTNTAPAATSTTTAEEVVEPLQVLVTNDDGVASPGIDAVVRGLLTLEFLEVTVVAPLDNQSGKGDAVTDPAAGELAVTETTTGSGYRATAVAGTPADSIVWAVEQNGLDQRPDFVVSGIDNGQNLSTSVIGVSGTIGAARRAAANGIPSIAVSFTTGENSDYAPAVQALLAWFTEHVPEEVAAAAEEPVTSFTSMNVPNCAAIGLAVVGTVEVAPGELGSRDYGALSCDGAPNPVDDVAAYQSGYVAISELALRV